MLPELFKGEWSYKFFKRVYSLKNDITFEKNHLYAISHLSRFQNL